MKKLENYFSSLWIANLGVDPSIAILFFLFFPAFFFLKFLLHLVCIVFEAMTISLSSLYKVLLKISPIYLSILLFIVKIFFFITTDKALATQQKHNNIKEILISKGEQFEIPTKDLARYSIGNKEVLKHIHIKRKNKIILKGKSIGFSDLIIWQEDQKKSFHVYVLSKKSQMEQVKLIESLKRTSLQIKVEGSLIFINGSITSLNEYFIIHSIIKKKNPNIIINVNLKQSLRNEIYAKVYKSFYTIGANKVICFNYEHQIDCSIQGLSLKHPQVKFISHKYSINLQNTIGILKDTNYTASFKIIQIENTDTTKRNIGLSKISAPLADLINSNYISLVEGEQTYLNEVNINATLLAEPQTSLVIDQKALISLGGEIPFQQAYNDQSITQWKFYGLKVNTVLKNFNGKPFLEYKTELTSPIEQNVNGSKGNSGIYVTTGKYIKLFEVGYKTSGNQQEGVPILNKIPILKYLFSSNYKSNSYKQIICYVKVEKKND